MPLTVFDTKGIPATQRERIEAEGKFAPVPRVDSLNLSRQNESPQPASVSVRKHGNSSDNVVPTKTRTTAPVLSTAISLFQQPIVLKTHYIIAVHKPGAMGQM